MTKTEERKIFTLSSVLMTVFARRWLGMDEKLIREVEQFLYREARWLDERFQP